MFWIEKWILICQFVGLLSFCIFVYLDWMEIVDRPANRGRYGNFNDDGPRGGGGGFDRNQREGSYGNNRDDR